jgi:hypothetical protein
MITMGGQLRQSVKVVGAAELAAQAIHPGRSDAARNIRRTDMSASFWLDFHASSPNRKKGVSQPQHHIA